MDVDSGYMELLKRDETLNRKKCIQLNLLFTRNLVVLYNFSEFEYSSDNMTQY